MAERVWIHVHVYEDVEECKIQTGLSSVVYVVSIYIQLFLRVWLLLLYTPIDSRHHLTVVIQYTFQYMVVPPGRCTISAIAKCLFIMSRIIILVDVCTLCDLRGFSDERHSVVFKPKLFVQDCCQNLSIESTNPGNLPFKLKNCGSLAPFHVIQ